MLPTRSNRSPSFVVKTRNLRKINWTKPTIVVFGVKELNDFTDFSDLWTTPGPKGVEVWPKGGWNPTVTCMQTVRLLPRHCWKLATSLLHKEKIKHKAFGILITCLYHWLRCKFGYIVCSIHAVITIKYTGIHVYSYCRTRSTTRQLRRFMDQK